MHWTALLARRSFDANARVVEDLDCIGCGYNLYGARAGARCPECGTDVGESLYLIRSPDSVAGALRTYARSFMALLALMLVPFGGNGPWFVALGLLAVASVFRLAAVAELRGRGRLGKLPVIGPRLAWSFALSCLEVVAAGVAAVGMFLVVGGGGAAAAAGTGTTGFGETLLASAVGVWGAALIASMLAIGAAGGALAAAMGYEFVDREFRIQRWLLMVTPVVAGLAGGVAVVFVFTNAGNAVRVMQLVAAGILLLGWGAGVVYTVVGLLHLAGAAEREREARDDVLADDPDEVVVFSQPPPEPPPIRVEGGERPGHG